MCSGTPDDDVHFPLDIKTSGFRSLPKGTDDGTMCAVASDAGGRQSDALDGDTKQRQLMLRIVDHKMFQGWI
jgi:hypothetical protein